MTDGDDIITVPWDSTAWDLAIKQRRDIGRLSADNDCVLFTPGRVIVDRDAAEDDAVQDVLRRGHARACDEPAADTARRLGLRLFTVADDRLVETVREIRAIVAGAASLDHVWLPCPNRPHGDDLPVPTDPPSAIQGVDETAGDGLRIYVIDTGTAQVPFDVEKRPSPTDDERPDENGDELRDHAAGHGTHVAGIIARRAPAATIVARRLLETPEGIATELATAQAIIDAGAEGANIINLSLGGASLFDAPPLATARAVGSLPPGTVVVAAAGNMGTERPNWPAACKGVIAVGSVGCDPESGEWRRTDFSSYGHWVDCCAPGVAVTSTFLHSKDATPLDNPPFQGWATWTGTSFSCPQVVAAIAARATSRGIVPSRAAWEVVQDPSLRRVGPIGTLVA